MLASGGLILNFFGATGVGRNFTGAAAHCSPLEPPMVIITHFQNELKETLFIQHEAEIGRATHLAIGAWLNLKYGIPCQI